MARSSFHIDILKDICFWYTPWGALTFSPENIFFCGYLDLKLFLQKEILLCLVQKKKKREREFM